MAAREIECQRIAISIAAHSRLLDGIMAEFRAYLAGIEVGHFTDARRPTGCTVVMAREGAVGGVDVRGAAPGTRETDLLKCYPRTLHIAPEVCIMRHLKPHFAGHPGQYVTADLESPLADLHFDVQQIPLADDSVDVILCNHLLEHVADDRKALCELYRILKPGGWGILLSPVEADYEQTFEDDTITDPDERTRIFGQYDHRRIYGADYTDRLRAAGFEDVSTRPVRGWEQFVVHTVTARRPD